MNLGRATSKYCLDQGWRAGVGGGSQARILGLRPRVENKEDYHVVRTAAVVVEAPPSRGRRGGGGEGHRIY